MRPTMPLPRIPAPRGVMVRQFLPTEHIADVRGTTKQSLLDAGLTDKVKRGQRIAITAGSRGIGGFVEVLAGIVDAVKQAGGKPFLVPAMGSHGGATPEGQTEILHRLGATEEAVGAPIRATMETIEVGTAGNGAVAHIDKNAADADGIIVMGRVKTHPESDAELASGLLKMITIGLGKQSGAYQAHSHGLWESVRAVPKVVMDASNILCGVAVVENGFRHPIVIEVVRPDYEEFLTADMRLLEIAKAHLATMPFDQLHVLVLDEIGKNISGAGLDPNVVGRWRVSGGPHVPDYHRLVVLNITPPSLGNGIGIGFADFTTCRVADTYDPNVTYVNLLTASEPGGTTREGPMPMALPCDRDAVEVALFSALAGDAPRLCRIRNTDALDEMWVSEALIGEVQGNPKLSIISELAPMPFDAKGNLF